MIIEEFNAVEILMGLSASLGVVADLKLGLRCGDLLELRLFSLCGSDLG